MGFGGLKAAKKLINKNFQVILIDQNNYFQFQPLFYQVAMSGIEPGSISFPVRKIFHNAANVHFRKAKALKIDAQNNTLITDNGALTYNYLLLAMGAGNNYFGNQQMEYHTLGMKSTSESLYLRNKVLEMLEENIAKPAVERNISISIIGGGPTGVELSGALAEMKKTVLPRDYPEINFEAMKVYLFEGSDRVLSNFAPKSSERAQKYLSKLGVEVVTGVRVNSFEKGVVTLDNNEQFNCGLSIWAAGIKPNAIEGIPEEALMPNFRIKCDAHLKVVGSENIYAIGDQALVEDTAWPKGHPQVAQPAIQQGSLFAKNLLRAQAGKPALPFVYKNKGNMATVGRNMAVAEIGNFKFGGFFAWMLWMVVHLMAIVGVKNRLFIFINWLWSYITYDQNLRLIITPYKKQSPPEKRQGLGA